MFKVYKLFFLFVFLPSASHPLTPRPENYSLSERGKKGFIFADIISRIKADPCSRGGSSGCVSREGEPPFNYLLTSKCVCTFPLFQHLHVPGGGSAGFWGIGPLATRAPTIHTIRTLDSALPGVYQMCALGQVLDLSLNLPLKNKTNPYYVSFGILRIKFCSYSHLYGK